MKKIYFLDEKKEKNYESSDEVESLLLFYNKEKDFINLIKKNLITLEENIDEEKVEILIEKIKKFMIKH